jgi:hypothetical protein
LEPPPLASTPELIVDLAPIPVVPPGLIEAERHIALSDKLIARQLEILDAQVARRAQWTM